MFFPFGWIASFRSVQVCFSAGPLFSTLPRPLSSLSLFHREDRLPSLHGSLFLFPTIMSGCISFPLLHAVLPDLVDFLHCNAFVPIFGCSRSGFSGYSSDNPLTGTGAAPPPLRRRRRRLELSCLSRLSSGGMERRPTTPPPPPSAASTNPSRRRSPSSSHDLCTSRSAAAAARFPIHEGEEG